MSEDEIIDIMKLPFNSIRTNQYFYIWKLSTGSDWNSCMCGNAPTRLYQVCKSYAQALENNKNKQ